MDVATLAIAMTLGIADEPTLGDLVRFPPSSVANKQWEFAKNHCELLESRIQFWGNSYLGRVYQTQRAEAEFNYRAWDALDDATRKDFYFPIRIKGLKRLRQIIGEEAYQRGEMPSCVPIHYFSRL